MIGKLYIHAGSHKCGSTSIQQFLYSNRAELLRRAIHTTKPYGSWQASLDVFGEGSTPQVIERFKKKGARRVIVSHEHFSWVDDINKLKIFKNELSRMAHKIQIIFYLRRQDSLAISHKQEGAKCMGYSAIAYGHDLSALPKTLSDVACRYLDYESKLNMWAEVFGQKNLIIRVLETEQLKGGDVIRDFCDIFGLIPDDYELPNRENTSLSLTSQLFLHQSHAQYSGKSAERKILVDALALVDKRRKNKEKLLPAQQQAIDFYQQFVVGNKRANKRYNISPNEAIFNDDFSMYPQAVVDQRLSEQQLDRIYAKAFEYVTPKSPA